MPHLEHDAKLLTPRAKLSRGRLAVYGGLTAVVGIVVVVVIFAATGSLAIEAESGTLSGPATVATVTGASGGKAVQFGLGSTPTSTPIAGGARGRAKVQNGTLVSDQGSLLRGGTLWFVPEAGGQYHWATSTSPWPVFGQYRLNTVRLAIEYGPKTSSNSPLTLTQAESYLDAAIAQATSHNMYAVVDLHWSAGDHDQPSAITFWQTIAARYKNNTNVIYELLNEPVSWRPGDYSSTDIADESQLYGIVHAAAPQTPVITMSFAISENSDTNSSPTMTDVAGKLTGVDWANTAVGFHGYWVHTSTGEAQLKQHYPAINTEFQTPCAQSGLPEDICQDGDTEEEQTMERLGISWLCWDCNDTSSSSNLASLEADATSKGYWWAADK